MNILAIQKGALYWITGLSGAGKTTVGTALYYKLKESTQNVVLLDGDILKNILGNKVGFTFDERHERAEKYVKLCKMLVDQGIIVICCTIAMFDDIRQYNRENNEYYVEIFLDVPIETLIERNRKNLYSKYMDKKAFDIAGMDIDVELPKNYDIRIVNNGDIPINTIIDSILEYDLVNKYAMTDDREYWNDYYKVNASTSTLREQSKFAEYIINYVKRGNKLLELGCGNGRDSLYFADYGLNVIGIDSSLEAINELNSKKKDNSLFVCDDFTTSCTLYQQQYDYCYSRFSLHSINKNQQDSLLKNIYSSLKSGSDTGYLFVEVRSVNDDIFGLGEYVGTNEYIYEGHYRRFIVKEELESSLNEVGFSIIESCEKRGFAPYGNQDPYIIRIIAQRVDNENE